MGPRREVTSPYAILRPSNLKTQQCNLVDFVVQFSHSIYQLGINVHVINIFPQAACNYKHMFALVHEYCLVMGSTSMMLFMFAYL